MFDAPPNEMGVTLRGGGGRGGRPLRLRFAICCLGTKSRSISLNEKKSFVISFLELEVSVTSFRKAPRRAGLGTAPAWRRDRGTWVRCC